MKTRVLVPLILLLTSCSVLSHSGSTLVVKGYERCGKCTQGAVEKGIAIISKAGGGVLRLKKNGHYSIKPKTEYVFDLPSNIIIEGNGATFFIEDNSNTKNFTWDAVFFAENRKNIKIKDLSLEVNGNNNPVLLKATTSGAHNHNGLLSALRTNVISIENCTVRDVRGYGAIYLGYCDNVTISGCNFYDIGVEKSNSLISDASVIMGVGNNWLVTGNHLENSYLSNCGTGLDLACANSVVSNNTVKSFWAGANLANNGLSESHDVHLEKNTFEDNATGLYLWASVKPFKGDCYNNLVKNNCFVWHTKQGWAVRGIDMGFFVYGNVHDISIEGNSFYAISDETSPSESYEIAMRIGPTEKTYMGSENKWGIVNNILIINNDIKGCTGPAVQIERTANQITIQNNIVADVASSTMSYSTKSAFVVTGSSKLACPIGISFNNNTVTKNRKIVNRPVFVRESEVRFNGEIIK